MRLLILQIRSLLFYAGYGVATILISLWCLLTSWMLPVRKRFQPYALWCRFVLFWLQLCCGIRYRIKGLETLPHGPVVVLSNHQSAWETVLLYYLFSPVCPIIKKELLNIPFWGWAMRLQRPIAIDRSNPRKASKYLLTEGPLRLKEGISVVIFPEGTRTHRGDKRRFSRGGAQLAVASGTPIVPVIHNAGHCWPPGTWLKYPGIIDVEIGTPIPVAGRNSTEVNAEFESWINAHPLSA
ncbi:MAG: lysophospholipid acyltransferase family protein [Pseudomonadales bacterium]|nr:lysophospholipid acyltransferase family protein [Pseudomonadales bacterium]